MAPSEHQESAGSARGVLVEETRREETPRDAFRRRGYAVARRLFRSDEVAAYRDHFDAMNRRQVSASRPDDYPGEDGDPLRAYPRILHPHRSDRLSLEWLLDERLRGWLHALLGRDPYAVQTMFYFKPPGARGQALHQDQYYLKVRPGTCVAAWMAVDRCDVDNGCLQVVPGSHELPVLCTVEANRAESFTDVTVPLPGGLSPEPVILEPGDVLFFNGQLIHGSLPNRSEDRFRRSLIGHYLVGEAERVAKHYFPVLRMDGSEVPLDVSEGGGHCGVWVDRDGHPVVEMRSGTTLHPEPPRDP